MKHRDRREQMRRLLTRREREGLTYVELGRRTGIPAGTLAWWSSRLRREVQLEPAGFVELVAESGSSAGSDAEGRIEVVLGNGLRLMVPPAADVVAVQRLVRALEERC
jgi:transcriptional regulator with XRE-family HTH domain